MSDIDIPLDDEPAEGAEAGPAPEEAPPAAEAETAVEAPLPARWIATARVTYTDGDGNEFFCGPGEAIPDEHVGQVDPGSVTPG